MALDMNELDLGTIIDGMENLIHSERLKSSGFRDSECGSRITASGFTETALGEGSDSYSLREIESRLKLARDISGILRIVKLEPEKLVKYHDIINRYSRNDSKRDPEVISLHDAILLKELTEVTKSYVKTLAREMKSNVQDIEHTISRPINVCTLNSDQMTDSDDTLSLFTKPLNPQRHKARRDSVLDGTIYAKDSVSQVGQLRNHLNLEKSVIGGYKPALSVLDEDEDVEIAPIHGLPKIFVNERLNFLCHLHKPLLELLSDGDEYPVTDIFERFEKFMRKHKGRAREPEANLLYMVIRNTFSLSRMQVKRNSFGLPMIEDGMHIDEEILFMCIEQLYSEYSMQWFNSMKSIAVPKFHDKYRGAMKSIKSKQRTTRHETDSKRKVTRSYVNF